MICVTCCWYAKDIDAHRVTRNGEEAHLTRTEWGLLEALSEHPGKLLTHHWLLEHVWGPGYADDLDVLRVFVSQLRRKIEPDPSRPRIIVTDPGSGIGGCSGRRRNLHHRSTRSA